MATTARALIAKGYPFARPSHSFVYVGAVGESFEIDESSWHIDHQEKAVVKGLDKTLGELGVVREAVPVLAIGSNASPEQMLRKYGKNPDVVVPVMRAQLHDFDAVYSTLIASYGSVTATLQYSPGTVLSLHVTMLSPDALKKMHQTEGGYDYCRLDNVKLEICGELHTTANVYLHKKGCLGLDHPPTPYAYATIPAENRIFPAVEQPEMLGKVSKLLTGRDDIDAFIEETADDVKRHTMTLALEKLTMRFAYPDYVVQEGLSSRHKLDDKSQAA